MTIEAVGADAFDAFEAAGWEERAAEYHRFFVPITSRLLEPLLDAAKVAPGTRALDVATGPGYVAAACAARGAAVVGVDVAGEMVMLARRLHPHLELVQAHAERLPFVDGSFDAVVGNFAILHFGRPERAVRELVRVLAPAGTLALSTWDVPERGRLPGILADAVDEAGAARPAQVPAGPSFFRFASEAELVRLLDGAGLREIEVRTISFIQRLSSADELWDGVLGGAVRMRALVLGQPHQLQARIRAAFDRLVRQYAVDGGLDIPVSVKLASGRVVEEDFQRVDSIGEEE